MRRAAELCTYDHLIVNDIRKSVYLRVEGKCLTEVPVGEIFCSHLQKKPPCVPGEFGEMESKWVMLASLHCGGR